MKMKPRKWTIVLVAILVLFGLYNLIWYAVVWGKYEKFVEGMRELYYHRTYVIDELDGYTYNVKIPNYLSFTGNLGIQRTQDANCALIVWPKIFKETEYGVILKDESGRNYAIKLTFDAEPAESTSNEGKRLVAKYSAEIDELFDRASRQWDY